MKLMLNVFLSFDTNHCIYKLSENGCKYDRCNFLIDIYGGLSRYTFIPEYHQYFP